MMTNHFKGIEGLECCIWNRSLAAYCEDPSESRYVIPLVADVPKNSPSGGRYDINDARTFNRVGFVATFAAVSWKSHRGFGDLNEDGEVNAADIGLIVGA